MTSHENDQYLYLLQYNNKRAGGYGDFKGRKIRSNIILRTTTNCSTWFETLHFFVIQSFQITKICHACRPNQVHETRHSPTVWESPIALLTISCGNCFLLSGGHSGIVVSCFTACKTMHVIILSVQKYQQPQFFPVRFDFLSVKTGIYRSSGISAHMQIIHSLTDREGETDG